MTEIPKLDHEQYLRLFERFVAENRDDPCLDVAILKAKSAAAAAAGRGSKSWLVVGPGLGHRENIFLNALDEGEEIGEIVALEPNPKMCEYLKRKVNNEDEKYWPNASKITILNATFEEFYRDETAVRRRFDLISAAHVLYYYGHGDERRRQIKHMISLLNPNRGTLIILLMENEADQLQMYHEFLPLMGRKRPVEDPLTAEKTFEEIESAAKEVGTFQTEYRSSKFRVKVEAEATEATFDRLSFMLDGNVRKLPRSSIEILLKWIADKKESLLYAEATITCQSTGTE